MKIFIKLSILLFIFSCMGCEKDWLDARSDKSIVVPSTIQDLQALMDNTDAMNGNSFGYGVLPALGETGADNYTLEDNVWASMSTVYKNAYIWNREIFDGATSNDWNKPYITVLYANVALEGIAKLDPLPNQQPERENIRGSALFFRAHAFFHLAQIFAKPYDKETAENDLGIPLRLSSDFSKPTVRSSLKETYERILADLKEAYSLLPETPLYKTRPSKPAVSGLLSRVYLIMGNYQEALNEAERCLKVYDRLMDYNEEAITENLPFKRFNEEVIFDASLCSSTALNNHIVDGQLFQSFNADDLRKTAFFRTIGENLKFKGSYIRSSAVLFAGIAVDEVYLTLSECYARQDNIESAMRYLDALLLKRWAKKDGASTYTPFQPKDKEEALTIILQERRKELIFRGIRWMDLRRLNKEGGNITITRTIKETQYALSALSLLYTYPIPDDIIMATGIEQNKR